MRKLQSFDIFFMNYKEISLPAYAYVPGLAKRHQEDFLDHVKELASKITTDENAKDNIAWLYGVRLFESEFFWECHEVLEVVWMNAFPNSREKQLVQGVIHLANAALKIRMKRPSAAQKLSILAEQSSQEAFMGIENRSLMLLDKADLSRAIEKLKNGNNTISIMNYNS